MIDLTTVASTVIAGVFTVLSIVIPLLLQKYLTNKQSAATLSTAIDNSLGAIQQAAQNAVLSASPKISIPGVSPEVAAGVQYVLDHAGAEAARFNITPIAIAEKISAKIGLANIQTNIATSSSPGPTTAPLAPIVSSSPVKMSIS